MRKTRAQSKKEVEENKKEVIIADPEIKETKKEKKEEPKTDLRDINIKEYLNDLANELHAPQKKKYPTRMVYAPYKDHTWSCDLMDMSYYKDENDGYWMVLNCVDVFTRYAFAKPLKSKNAQDVLEAFKDICKESGRMPKFLYVDEGKEFKNKELDKWRKENDIGLYHTYSKQKSVIVERFNRTLRLIMMKWLTANNTHAWVDELPKFISDYNNIKHGAFKELKFSPTEASLQENQRKVSEMWKMKLMKRHYVIEPKYKVNDWVRINRIKGIFEKGADVNWSREVFLIIEIDNSKYPTVYHLQDRFGEKIKGTFYEQELLKAEHGDIVLVDKVLKTRGKGKNKELFVSYLGYDSSHNSWIKADSTVKL
jgi:transposase InsO family protein